MYDRWVALVVVVGWCRGVGSVCFHVATVSHYMPVGLRECVLG